MALPPPSAFIRSGVTRPNIAPAGSFGTLPLGVAAPEQARQDLAVKDNITNLKEEKKLYSQSVDLPSVNANTTANHDITTTRQTCDEGDYVEFIGGTIDHGYIPVGCLPCPANDTIRLRVANVTGGAINPAATTLYFVIHKFVSTQ